MFKQHMSPRDSAQMPESGPKFENPENAAVRRRETEIARGLAFAKQVIETQLGTSGERVVTEPVTIIRNSVPVVAEPSAPSYQNRPAAEVTVAALAHTANVQERANLDAALRQGSSFPPEAPISTPVLAAAQPSSELLSADRVRDTISAIFGDATPTRPVPQSPEIAAYQDRVATGTVHAVTQEMDSGAQAPVFQMYGAAISPMIEGGEPPHAIST